MSQWGLGLVSAMNVLVSIDMEALNISQLLQRKVLVTVTTSQALPDRGAVWL